MEISGGIRGDKAENSNDIDSVFWANDSHSDLNKEAIVELTRIGLC